MGLSAALANSGHALGVFSAGLAVSGNNLANASTPGYAREDLRVEPAFPFTQGGQTVGSGVRAGGVRQAVDLHLEGKLHAAAGGAAAAGAGAELFAGLERALGELTDGDLSTALSDFSAAVGAVVAEPTSSPLRHFLVEEGAALAADFASLADRAGELSSDLNARAGGLVEEANGLIGEVDRLNRRIVQLERGGLSESHAGPLRNDRYAAMRRLAEIVPLDFRPTETGTVELRTGDDWLLLGDSVQTLELEFPPADPTAGSSRPPVPVIRTSRTRSEIALGGELGGTLDGADRIVGGFLDDLDGLAAGLIRAVNRVHTGGRGSVGHTAVTAGETVTDPAASLAAGAGRVGLPFAPTHGAFTLTVVDKNTGAEADTRIEIDLDGLGGPDTSLSALAAALDGVDGVSSGLDSLGRLTVTADGGRAFHFADDTSGVLSALGINTFFAGRDAGSIRLAEPLRTNPDRLAVGRGGGPADNSNVLALADALAGPLTNTGDGEVEGKTLDGRLAEIVGAVGRGAAAETALADAAAAHRDALAGQREQFSGVSLDEEAVKVMELQRQYQASARVISVVDELFATLLNL